MDAIIAVRVTLDTGADRYFLTWGRLGGCDPWPGDIERAVLKASNRYALGGAPAQARVCDSLQEASAERYFFECLISLQQQMPSPARKKFTAWAEKVTAAVLRGEELHYLGRPKAEERAAQDTQDTQDARFWYELAWFAADGGYLGAHRLDGLTPEEVQHLLDDEDVDRVMCLTFPVSGPVLAAIVAGRDIAVDENAYLYYLTPCAERGFRTPSLPAGPDADDS